MIAKNYILMTPILCTGLRSLLKSKLSLSSQNQHSVCSLRTSTGLFTENVARCYCQVAEKTDSLSSVSEDSAIEVAMSVNKIKKSHQATSASNEKKNMESVAWEKLNSLTEEKIMSADGKAVALLLNSWAYFSKHWEKGKDGPNSLSQEKKEKVA